MKRRWIAGAAALALAVPSVAPAGAAQPVVVASTGVGGLDGRTPFTRDAVAAALTGFRVVEATGASEGGPYPLFEARRYGKAALRVRGGPDHARVRFVTVETPRVATVTGVRVGMRFSRVFAGKTPQNCWRGLEEASGQVLCPAPDLPHVVLFFRGGWKNIPDSVMPPPADLARSVVTAIVWSAD